MKLQKLKNILKDNDRKSLYRIIDDLFKIFKDKNRSGSIGYYFFNLMYKKDSGNINDYLSYGYTNKIRFSYYRKNGEHPILQNKNNFRDYVKEHNISVPEYVGKIKGGFFVAENKNKIKINQDNFAEIFDELLSDNEAFFIKAVGGQGGEGVFKVSKDNLNLIRLNYSLEYIVEKALLQGNYLNSINPFSLNTLRVITYNNGSTIEIASCFFRMGTGESYVDNGSSGGIFIDYDIYDNKLAKKAYRLFDYGGESFEKHPTTGFVFKGKELPYSRDVVDLVTMAAKLFPELEIVGWDIAYTNEGPVILEGNDNPHIVMMQIGCKGLKNNKIYKDLFKPYYN